MCVHGGANLSRKFSTLFISNFLFLIWTLDVDFSLKIPHPPMSRKFSTLNSSKKEKTGMPNSGRGEGNIYDLKGPKAYQQTLFEGQLKKR